MTSKKKEKKKKDTDLDRAKILESIQIQDPGLKSILEPPTVSFESPDLDTNSIATTNTENFDMMDSFFKDVQPGLSKFLGNAAQIAGDSVSRIAGSGRAARINEDVSMKLDDYVNIPANLSVASKQKAKEDKKRVRAETKKDLKQS